MDSEVDLELTCREFEVGSWQNSCSNDRVRLESAGNLLSDFCARGLNYQSTSIRGFSSITVKMIALQTRGNWFDYGSVRGYNYYNPDNR